MHRQGLVLGDVTVSLGSGKKQGTRGSQAQEHPHSPLTCLPSLCSRDEGDTISGTLSESTAPTHYCESLEKACVLVSA